MNKVECNIVKEKNFLGFVCGELFCSYLFSMIYLMGKYLVVPELYWLNHTYLSTRK